MALQLSMARRVLNDCRIALTLLETTDDDDLFRVQWVGALALIRAVGHVLYKIDGRDDRVKSVAEAFYKRWTTVSEHPIFRHFIDEQRNLILKEYENFASDQPTVIILVNNKQILDKIFTLDTGIFRPLLSDYKFNEDARDVYSEADADPCS